MPEEKVTQKEYDQYISGLEDENDVLKEQKRQLTKGQISMFEGVDEENLIKWQLDLTGDKERIYHLLKGDKLQQDGEGNITYTVPTDIRDIPFCDHGVSMIMQLINYYLTKNTILSNYDTKTIDWKIYDFGIALNDYFHNHYEELLRIPTFREAKEILLKRVRERRENTKDIYKDFFGQIPREEILNNIERLEMGKMNVIIEIEQIQEDYRKEKEKMLPLIHQAIVNTVHSSYLRAWKGGERESLRTARVVNQSEPLGGNKYASTPPMQTRKFSINPLKWGR